MFIYHRNISVELLVGDNDRTQAVSRLVITSPGVERKYVYQIWFELDNQSLEIIDSRVDSLTPETPACDRTKALISRLHGVRLGKSYPWKVFNILGRADGCQHLYELALEIGRAYSNMKVGEYILTTDSSSHKENEVLFDLKKHCAGLAALAAEEPPL